MKLSDIFCRERNFIPIKVPSIPYSQELEYSCRRIYKTWPNTIRHVEIKDREILIEKLCSALESWNFSDIYTHTLNSIVIFIFNQELYNEPKHERLRNFILKEFDASNENTSLNNAFVLAYLECFSYENEYTKIIAKKLKNKVEFLPPKWLRTLAIFPTFFDPEKIVIDISNQIIIQNDPKRFLIDISLIPHQPGLMHEVNLCLYKLYKPNVTNFEIVNDLLKWIKIDNDSEGVLKSGKEAIETLLKPWTTSKISPTDEVINFITSEIVNMYQDPRIFKTSFWHQIDSDCVDLFIRWLTREDIRFFMDVVSDSNPTHMWPARKKFWLGLHDEGLISGAWVAFSPSAYEKAIDLKNKYNENKETTPIKNFGIQSSKNSSRKNTSLLILKIGNYIIVEGSTDYKIQIFKDSIKERPNLYERSYNCEDIRILGSRWKPIQHTGNWQARFRNYLMI